MNALFWNKISSLADLNPTRIVVEKSYQYYAFERNEKLQSYRVLININETTTAHIMVMVGKEVYVDEVVCTILYKTEKIYSGNISLVEVVEKLNNIEDLEKPYVDVETQRLTNEFVVTSEKIKQLSKE